MTNPIGLLGEPIPKAPDQIDEAVAEQVAALGFTAVGLHLGAGLALEPEAIETSTCHRIRSTFEAAGVRVLHSWGWGANLVHADPGRRREALRRLGGACRVAADLGAAAVITGCGSRHPNGGYSPHPLNHSEKAREQLVESLHSAVESAERYGVMIALECHVLTTLDTPERAREVVDEVASDLVKLNIDPVNLIDGVRPLYDSRAHGTRVVDVLGDVAISGHVKDASIDDEFVVHISEAPLGEGVYDVRSFVEAFVRKLPAAPLFLEHLPASRVPAARAALGRILAEIGTDGTA